MSRDYRSAEELSAAEYRALAAEHRAESAKAGAEAAPHAASETADVLAEAAEFEGRSTRCPQALEVTLPDAGDGYEQPVLVLQCDRDAGHLGTHRYPGPATWTPRRRRRMPDSVIRTVTKWGVQLPDGQVRTADDAEDANRIRDMLRDTITEEFGVPMADYDPRIVQRTETTTTSEWVHTPFAGIEKGIT